MNRKKQMITLLYEDLLDVFAFTTIPTLGCIHMNYGSLVEG